MTYKFVDIASLFERFAIDAFDIVSGMKEAEKEYKGFFGDSPREIYAKVVQNKVETKVFVRVEDRHEYGFATDTLCTMYRFFLPLDALNGLEKEYLSFEEKDKISNFLYKIGKFSDFEDFEFFHVGTLTDGDNHGLIGITDEGDEVRGKFFRPLRKGESLTIKGIKVPVPSLNITPVPSLRDEDVEEAQKNFEKEVGKYKKEENFKNIGKVLDHMFNITKEGLGDIRYMADNSENVIYKYIGDFKYEEQVKDILDNFNWELTLKLARIVYKTKDTEDRSKLSDADLLEALKYDALFVLRRVYIERGDYYSYGLFTAENSGGVLSLDFTPVSWEHCNTELECDEKKVDLNKIKF